MSKFKDLTGQTFGELTVIERAGTSKNGHALWLCRCSCGNECVVATCDLTRNHSTKCRKCASTKHGRTGEPIYRTWQNMLDRCENPNYAGFDDYGGRGIKVCERWHDIYSFYDDISILPHFGEKGYSLDRIDVNGDYCPENVRWASRKEQQNNKRNNVKVEYNGEEMTLAEAAEKSGINYGTLRKRYHAGKRGDDLFTPIKK